MAILVIDNYDSFTFNLVQHLGELGAESLVYRNDAITIEQIEALKPQRILLSPGPCTPNEAGITLATIKHFAGKIPIFGVCLGHQSIGQSFGGNVIRAPRLMHGRTCEISHLGTGIFESIESPMIATRYHSLVVERSSLPSCLEITAWADDHTEAPTIMAFRHRELDVVGVQFHPESFLTTHGKTLLKNWLNGKR